MNDNQIKRLKEEQLALRRLTYKDDAITRRLETIQRLLEETTMNQEKQGLLAMWYNQKHYSQ